MTPDFFHFCYIERVKTATTDTDSQAGASQPAESMSYYNFFDYPAAINKKVVLLQHFKSYLEGNSKFRPLSFAFSREAAPPRPANIDIPCYVKKWKRAKKAILLRNSNKVIQVLF